MKYALALDVGTTSLKGVLFDAHAGIAAAALQEYELSKPKPDIVEMDAGIYWSAARRVIRKILHQSRISPRRIISVGITSQGETLLVLDKQGRPLRKAIVWLDNRSGYEADEIGRALGPDAIYRMTGQQEMIPTWTATRILWLRRHEAAVFRKARKYLLAGDYLMYRLTGKYVTDRALNPSTLYFDIRKGEWWPAMLGFLGIDAAHLPALADSGSAIGTVSPEAAAVTGLTADTLVTTAPIDQIAGAIGAGNIAPGMITETTGAAMALCACVKKPTYDPGRRVGLYCHALRGNYVLLPWAPVAGMALRWFRDELGGGLDYHALCQAAGRVPPGADGLMIFPHLCGAGCPDVNPRAKGVFWGIALGHTRAHFTRAILEATAFMLKGNLELLNNLGFDAAEIRSLGGAARSDLWLQIKADVCGKRMLAMECAETTCLGAAMLSFVGNGTYRNLAEAAARMVRVRRTIRPNPRSARAYAGIYDRYCRCYDRMKGLFPLR